MRLYHYRTWMGKRAVVNFTFPSPDWNSECWVTCWRTVLTCNYNLYMRSTGACVYVVWLPFYNSGAAFYSVLCVACNFVNISDLKLQYKVNSTQGLRCRQFNLHGVTLPLNDTLVFDCVMFDAPGEAVLDGQVTVVNNRGDGRTYAFRLPSQSRISKLSFIGKCKVSLFWKRCKLVLAFSDST